MSHTSKSITLDRENSEQTNRFKRSMKQVRWSRALMQIFWTAGPVTGLGLIGGYYIGYGTMPSTQLLIYFISFTVFSGLIGLLAKVVYDGTRGHVHDQGRRDLLNISGKLGDLILAARDMVAQNHEEGTRKTESALQLLKRVDLTPYGVNIAFTDLTESKEIGRVMAHIYAYRRIGLYSRVDEIYNENKELIEKTVSVLESHSPEAARELGNWFTGTASLAMKQGIDREPHFLQRVMAAIEFNNPYLMTIRDVEEMLILAFELIHGRKIPTLVFSYSGKWRYARSLDELEKKRSRFRVAQARGGNRLRALASYLRETGVTNYEELPNGLTMHQLADRVVMILDNLSREIEKDVKSKSAGSEDITRRKGIMIAAVELYKMAREGYRETGKHYKDLMEAAKRWDKITSDKPANLRVGTGKRGLRIKEDLIELDEEARLEVCRNLSWYFEKEGFTGNVYQWLAKLDALHPEHRGEMLRLLAIEIALALEPHIGLSKREIQRNINATKATYLGGISPYMNADQKAEHGRQMAQEVDNSPSRAAEQLAEVLVRIYHVELSDEARNFLQFNYGARREVLDLLAGEQENPSGITTTDFVQPPDIPAVPSLWDKMGRT